MKEKKLTIIPAIDLIDGNIVRLTQGDYQKRKYYKYNLTDLIKSFEDSGIERLHLVDLNAAKIGQIKDYKILEKIRKSTKMKIEFGGGIRNEKIPNTLFNIGIDYAILGSILIKDFETSKQIIKKYPNRIIAGLDCKEDKIATNGWIESSEILIFEFLEKLKGLALESIIYTNIEKDGMLQGPDIQGLKKLCKETTFPIIASGGIHHIQDIQILKKIGQNCVGCIIGKAILDKKISLKDLKNVI